MPLLLSNEKRRPPQSGGASNTPYRPEWPEGDDESVSVVVVNGLFDRICRIADRASGGTDNITCGVGGGLSGVTDCLASRGSCITNGIHRVTSHFTSGLDGITSRFTHGLHGVASGVSGSANGVVDGLAGTFHRTRIGVVTAATGQRQREQRDGKQKQQKVLRTVHLVFLLPQSTLAPVPRSLPHWEDAATAARRCGCVLTWNEDVNSTGCRCHGTQVGETLSRSAASYF